MKPGKIGVIFCFALSVPTHLSFAPFLHRKGGLKLIQRMTLLDPQVDTMGWKWWNVTSWPPSPSLPFHSCLMVSHTYVREKVMIQVSSLAWFTFDFNGWNGGRSFLNHHVNFKKGFKAEFMIWLKFFKRCLGTAVEEG